MTKKIMGIWQTVDQSDEKKGVELNVEEDIWKRWGFDE